MNTDTVVRARIDVHTKEQAAVALHAMGLTVSDAIRLLMLRIVDEQRLPFDVKMPTSVAHKAMKELDADKGERFDSPAALFRDLGF